MSLSLRGAPYKYTADCVAGSGCCVCVALNNLRRLFGCVGFAISWGQVVAMETAVLKGGVGDWCLVGWLFGVEPGLSG